ncbi:MAG: molybdopterin oxidoreductase family protein, partial [Deltaproteobacteria bacterium]|nr:molybdopterin oxidoreductase family protein [Deltaproteobacteria bacterium]
ALLPYSYAGTMGVVQYNAGHPFFHKLGASLLRRTICSSAMVAGFHASMGSIPTTDIESTVNSDLIIIWGNNTISTNMHAWPFFLAARKNGAEIVVIDPYRNQTAEKADRHLALKPGTDAALALGLMQVLIAENLIDHQYIDKYTLGFDRLVERVRQYPLSRVQEITGVPSEQIKQLALDYGRARAPYIRLGWGPARQHKGGMAARTITLLPALVGAPLKKGGGLTRSTSPAAELNMDVVKREDLAPLGIRSVNMVQLGKALNQLDQPPIKALHVYHSNPAVVAPDSRSVLAGLSRDDLFTVVHEVVLSETALYADLVLPSATFLELTDIYQSYGHYYLQMAWPVIEPEGECRSTLSIFQELAQRFGFTEECFSKSEQEIIRELWPADSPYFKGLTVNQLFAGRPLRLNVPENPLADGFGTPSGKVEFYSAGLAGQGLDPLPDGAPSLDPEGVDEYPLQLITPPRHQFLNSTFAEVDGLRAKAGPPTIMIHPEDAGRRNIQDGNLVKVFNKRGDFQVYAQITTRVTPGLTVVEGLYWPRFMPGQRGVNQITGQHLTDMGQSCAFHGNLVEIELASPESVT